MRRNILLVMLSAFLLIVFTACNSDSGASATEVFEKGVEVADSMESVEMNVTMDQTMTVPGEDPMQSESNFVIQTTLDPLTLHQKGTTSMDMEGMPDESIDMEMYMVDDQFYLYEGASDEWIEMGSEFADLFDMMGAEQQDPSEQLELFEDYVKEFSFDEVDGSYVFQLELDEGSVDELFDELIEQSMPDDMQMFMGEADIMEDIEIGKLAYEFTFDQETYEMKTYDLVMDMTIEVEGMELSVEQDMKTEYSKMNEIDPIEIPQEVIDNAVDDLF